MSVLEAVAKPSRSETRGIRRESVTSQKTWRERAQGPLAKATTVSIVDSVRPRWTRSRRKSWQQTRRECDDVEDTMTAVSQVTKALDAALEPRGTHDYDMPIFSCRATEVELSAGLPVSLRY